jgi:hypothetical protein
MPEPVENLIEESQGIVKEQVEVVRAAVRELQRVLLENSLMQAYREAAAPLDAEAAHLITQIQTLSKSRDELTPRLEARRRLLATEVDVCIAAGNDDEAAGKRAQVEEEEKRLSELGERIGRDAGRLQAIGAEKSRAAVQIFEAAYPEFRVASFAMIEGLLDLLDGLKKGLFDYTTATGISGDPDRLPKSYHIQNLLPNELPGSDRQLSGRVDIWLGTRR